MVDAPDDEWNGVLTHLQDLGLITLVGAEASSTGLPSDLVVDAYLLIWEYFARQLQVGCEQAPRISGNDALLDAESSDVDAGTAQSLFRPIDSPAAWTIGLWPGEVGAFVPQRRTIVLPLLDITDRPDLEARGFMISLPRNRDVAGTPNITHDRMVAEAMHWSDRHQLGTRSTLRFGHAFTRWRETHRESHPDYIVVPPEGEAQRSERGVKLCTSNPAVIEHVIADWQAAGRPASWNVCPIDGIGFCTCERSHSGF